MNYETYQQMKTSAYRYINDITEMYSEVQRKNPNITVLELLKDQQEQSSKIQHEINFLDFNYQNIDNPIEYFKRISEIYRQIAKNVKFLETLDN